MSGKKNKLALHLIKCKIQFPKKTNKISLKPINDKNKYIKNSITFEEKKLGSKTHVAKKCTPYKAMADS